MDHSVGTLHLPAKVFLPLPFSRVLPDDLESHWAFVERGLNVVRSLCDEPWTADDILRCLVDEQAALYVRGDGFVILEQCNESISRRKYLNVWIMWFSPGRGKAIQREVIAWLDAMRLAHSCEWIQFSSPRDGWAGIEPDFVRHRVIWRRQ